MANQQTIAAVRRFNRFYTRQIGVLRKTYLDSPYSLGEMRVLYELAQADKLTASEIARTLDLDMGYLSRLLRNFEKRGLISRKTSATDARQHHLALTTRGQKIFAPMEKRSQQHTASMLAGLDRAEQTQIVSAMSTIESLLANEPAAKSGERPTYTLRSPRAGDFGWIVSRHAELYLQEYGWGAPFEGLCAQIVADFVNNFDPKHEGCWIADIDGENVGCVMLVKDEQPHVARLRLLLVDPKARGLGLGARLVDECVRFARTTGYTKMTLWTHSVLAAARHVYERAGFRLTSSEPRHSWGKDVVAEFWDLEL
ncbi:MAG TPA: helix-turn-helix domain-containing GNAT family N-acetyltransferase [Pseudolabrys sp.]|jgi:DNA-binding MarR family transcriptional regulator/GNAT superfamily N-acetyltransferase